MQNIISQKPSNVSGFTNRTQASLHDSRSNSKGAKEIEEKLKMIKEGDKGLSLKQVVDQSLKSSGLVTSNERKSIGGFKGDNIEYCYETPGDFLPRSTF